MNIPKTLTIIAIVLGLGLGSGAASARMHRRGSRGKRVMVTGCLQKNEQENEFSIAGDGKTYDLMSDSSVALQDHVGHKVTLTGSDVSKTLSKDEQDESVAGHLRVTKLKMVSTSCP